MNRPKIYIILLAMSIASLAVAGSLASFKWDETSYDFGKIKQGKPVTASFSFTNAGPDPLVISSAKGSCGCTGVEYPQSPVLSGKGGVIKATYNAAALGPFNKTITVESNTEEGVTTLRISGEVVKD